MSIPINRLSRYWIPEGLVKGEARALLRLGPAELQAKLSGLLAGAVTDDILARAVDAERAWAIAGHYLADRNRRICLAGHQLARRYNRRAGP